MTERPRGRDSAYAQGSINDYLADLAARLPAPGGGSAAALVGATGVALLEMVAQYSNKVEHAEELAALLPELGKHRATLISLIDGDVEAYRIVSACRGMSQKDPEVQAAYVRAMNVPLDAMHQCHGAVRTAPILARWGNKRLLSDVDVGVRMLMAAGASALANVRVNLPYIDDKDLVGKTEGEIGRLEEELLVAVEETLEILTPKEE